jgi:rhodanese-related sulfurtransferase
VSGDYFILDVRRADEFAISHVPRTINTANEYIASAESEGLADKNETIYMYCRS